MFPLQLHRIINPPKTNKKLQAQYRKRYYSPQKLNDTINTNYSTHGIAFRLIKVNK